jgi:hypothetical protein
MLPCEENSPEDSSPTSKDSNDIAKKRNSSSYLSELTALLYQLMD